MSTLVGYRSNVVPRWKGQCCKQPIGQGGLARLRVEFQNGSLVAVASPERRTRNVCDRFLHMKVHLKITFRLSPFLYLKE
jgi:hypothetical protein